MKVKLKFSMEKSVQGFSMEGGIVSLHLDLNPEDHLVVIKESTESEDEAPSIVDMEVGTAQDQL